MASYHYLVAGSLKAAEGRLCLHHHHHRRRRHPRRRRVSERFKSSVEQG